MGPPKQMYIKISILAKIYRISEKLAFLFVIRFLDHILQVFTGTTKQIHELYNEINQIRPTLKFTFVHTSVKNERKEDQCDCEKNQNPSHS